MITEKLKEHAPTVAGALVAAVSVALFVRRRREKRRTTQALLGGVNYPVPGAELYDYAPLTGVNADDSALDKARDGGSVVAAKLEAVTRRYPALAGGVLVAAGIGAGMALPQSAKERVYVTQLLDRVKHLAKDLAHQGVSDIKESLNNPITNKVFDLLDEKLEHL